MALALFGLAYYFQFMGTTHQAISNTAQAQETPSLLKKALPVSVVPVQYQDAFVTQRRFTGNINTRQSTSLSFEIPGKIKSWLVEEGQFVEKDQPIAKLDTEKTTVEGQRLQAMLEQAEARLTELEAGPRKEQITQAKQQVKLAKQRLAQALLTQERLLQVVEQAAGTDYEYQLSSLEVTALQAQKAMYEARLNELENGTREEHVLIQKAEIKRIQSLIADNALRLKDAVLKSPFAGQLSNRQVSTGAIIQPGQALVDLKATQSLEARISVPVEVLDQMDLTKPHTLSLGQKELKLTVSRHLASLDEQTRSAILVFNLPKLAQPALLGRSIHLNLAQQTSQRGFYVPTQALHPDEHGLWYIQVLTQQQPEGPWVIERRYVEIIRTEAQQTYLRGPIKDGEFYIPEGRQRIADDQVIEPVFLDSVSHHYSNRKALFSRPLNQAYSN